MNRKKAVFVAAVLATVGALAAGNTAGSEAVHLEQVGVEVSIAPTDMSGIIYECTAVVTDLASERVLSSPKVLFKAGEEAQIRVGTKPGLDLHIVVSVNEEKTEAQYSASIYRGEALVSSQKVKVALGRVARAVV